MVRPSSALVNKTKTKTKLKTNFLSKHTWDERKGERRKVLQFGSKSYLCNCKGIENQYVRQTVQERAKSF